MGSMTRTNACIRLEMEGGAIFANRRAAIGVLAVKATPASRVARKSARALTVPRASGHCLAMSFW
jgi:hypothetical protein